MSGAGWDTRLSFVVGKAATRIADELGVRTVGELLEHSPRRYLDRDQVTRSKDLVEGELVAVVVTVGSVRTRSYRDKRTGRPAYRTEVETRLADGPVWLTFFDRYKGAEDHRRRQFPPGSRVMVSGRFGRNRFQGGRWELTHPEMLDASEGEDTETTLKALYPAAGKLDSLTIERAVRAVLHVLDPDTVPEPLPEPVRREHGLLDAATAVRWLHRPADQGQLARALRRHRFAEAFVAQVVLAQRRHAQRELSAVPRVGRDGGVLDAFDARMPYALTQGQQRVEKEIVADLAAGHPMHRLLQGEVGSGKTVVALRAMLRVVDSGAQAALLAPTEVLAQQHLRSVAGLLGDLARAGELGAPEEATRVTLLTGSMPAAARRAALLQAASGEAGIVIGTHALLEQSVQFADLGLVVVDEQHRFGVEQRAALAAKAGGSPPHELVMTATPIPRTVAMTVFGDLETSALTELPAGRAPIQTTVVPVAEQPAWVDRVWQRVREEVAAGRQAYVVCPRIALSDDERSVEAETGTLLTVVPDEPETDRPPLAAVEEVAARLAAEDLAGLRVAGLHGRMPSEEKDAVMRSFAAGEMDVLVSTTVIEVGVDVGNASVMVLLDADRFGTSQLHQLRGRVGRGGHRGLCLLLTGSPPASPARVRLDAVASTTDGFRLAELDLELRREGDVLGARQSGTRRTLRLLSVLRDADLIEDARAAAVDLVEADPSLAGHPGLLAAVADLEDAARTEFLDMA